MYRLKYPRVFYILLFLEGGILLGGYFGQPHSINRFPRYNTMVRANKPARRFRITKQVRRKRSARKKLIVIYYYYRHHSIRETASRFNIEPKQVRDWIRKKDKLMKAS